MSKAKADSKSKARTREFSRGGPARRVAEMLPDIGGVAFRRFGFVQSSIVCRWPEIVGAHYAQVSTPESLRFPQGKREMGALTLRVGGAHVVTIQHIIPEIITRVNRFFGYDAVARILLKQGTVKARAQSYVAMPPQTLSNVMIPEELGDSLRTIADPELKAILESLARGVTAQRLAPIGKIS